LSVFIGAGAFTHEDQRRGRIAYAEDQLVAAFVETAAAAVSNVGQDLRKGFGGNALFGHDCLRLAGGGAGGAARRRYSVLIPRSW